MLNEARRNLPVRVETPTPKRAAKPKAAALARVALFSPVAIGKLRAAQALGAKLSVSFDGYTLTVSAER